MHFQSMTRFTTNRSLKALFTCVYGIVVRILPIVKFDDEVLHANLEQGSHRARGFRLPWRLPATTEQRGSTREPVRSRGVAQLGPRWPETSWPQEHGGSRAAAAPATADGGGGSR
jgi:hypothetical protein